MSSDSKVDVIENVAPPNSEASPVCLSPTCSSCNELSILTRNLVAKIQVLIGDEGLTPVNVISVCIELMKVAETSMVSGNHLTGVQKKALVISALQLFIQNNGGDVGLLATVPGFIDAIVSAYNGTLTLAEVEQVGLDCCIGLGMCCAKKK